MKFMALNGVINVCKWAGTKKRWQHTQQQQKLQQTDDDGTMHKIVYTVRVYTSIYAFRTIFAMKWKKKKNQVECSKPPQHTKPIINLQIQMMNRKLHPNGEMQKRKL